MADALLLAPLLHHIAIGAPPGVLFGQFKSLIESRGIGPGDMYLVFTLDAPESRGLLTTFYEIRVAAAVD